MFDYHAFVCRRSRARSLAVCRGQNHPTRLRSIRAPTSLHPRRIRVGPAERPSASKSGRRRQSQFGDPGLLRGWNAIHPLLGRERYLFLWRFFGGQGVNRTLDTKIFSLLLYRLSYLPTAPDGVLRRLWRPARNIIRTDPATPLQGDPSGAIQRRSRSTARPGAGRGGASALRRRAPRRNRLRALPD